jgi:hypothetical protein
LIFQRFAMRLKIQCTFSVLTDVIFGLCQLPRIATQFGSMKNLILQIQIITALTNIEAATADVSALSNDLLICLLTAKDELEKAHALVMEGQEIPL